MHDILLDKVVPLIVAGVGTNVRWDLKMMNYPVLVLKYQIKDFEVLFHCYHYQLNIKYMLVNNNIDYILKYLRLLGGG